MHKNITISDLNVEIDGNGDNIKKHLVAKVGLGIIEVSLFNGLSFCYTCLFLVFVGVSTALLWHHSLGIHQNRWTKV